MLVLSYDAHCAAPPAAAWELFARPDRWSRWAPHLRGAWNLGAPEVEPGRLGAARLLGVIPVPARITGKEDGRTWTWQVGPVTFVHAVRPRSDGTCTVAVDLSAPAPLEAVLAVSYGPVVQHMVQRLASAAEAGPVSSGRSSAP